MNSSRADRLWIDIAERVSQESKDRSTKVGCVIVNPENNTILSTGWNGFPRGIDDNVDERHERPAKYLWTEHAERNALYNAARNGISVEGATAYLNWGGYPCENCARGLVQSGIRRVVVSNRPFPGVGNGVHYHCDVAQIMFKETGIQYDVVEIE